MHVGNKAHARTAPALSTPFTAMLGTAELLELDRSELFTAPPGRSREIVGERCKTDSVYAVDLLLETILLRACGLRSKTLTRYITY